MRSIMGYSSTVMQILYCMEDTNIIEIHDRRNKVIGIDTHSFMGLG